MYKIKDVLIIDLRKIKLFRYGLLPSKLMGRLLESKKFLWGLSSAGRASDLHSEGQEFDSPSLQNSSRL